MSVDPITDQEIKDAFLEFVKNNLPYRPARLIVNPDLLLQLFRIYKTDGRYAISRHSRIYDMEIWIDYKEPRFKLEG